MKAQKLLIALSLFALVLSACGSVAGDEPTPIVDGPMPGSGHVEPSLTPDPNEPVSSDDPTVEPTPTLDPENAIVKEATVTGVEVVLLESWPLQASAQISGDLPDGCTQSGPIHTERDGDTFRITVKTTRPGDAVCTEQLKPFTESVSLDIEGLAAGTYTVDANGVTATFTLAQDNVIQEDPAGAALPQEDQAELIRLALERALVAQEIPDYGLLADQGQPFVLSTENIDPALVPELADVSLTLLTPDEIRARANEEGDFLYLRFDKITAQSADKVTVSLSNTWAVAENSETGYLSGGGFTIEYTRENGAWTGEVTSMWIS